MAANKRVRRTYQQIFIDKLKEMSGQENNYINSMKLREQLGWDLEFYTRIRNILLEQDIIASRVGGPGGSLCLKSLSGSDDALKLFVSYSHVDEEIKASFIKHIQPLSRMNLISEWHDAKIEPGDKWSEKIIEQINGADIVIFLVSIDFINSKYCYDIEMETALKRNDNLECVVIPVLMRKCLWQHTPLGALQALPKDAKPVASWPDMDEAFVNVVEGIKLVAEGLQKKK